LLDFSKLEDAFRKGLSNFCKNCFEIFETRGCGGRGGTFGGARIRGDNGSELFLARMGGGCSASNAESSLDIARETRGARSLLSVPRGVNDILL